MRIALPSGGTANVSPDIKPETIDALDEMMEAAKRMFAEPATPLPKPCGDRSCRHSRRQHLKRHYKGGKGRFSGFAYGACRAKGCRCATYYPE